MKVRIFDKKFLMTDKAVKNVWMMITAIILKVREAIGIKKSKHI